MRKNKFLYSLMSLIGFATILSSCEPEFVTFEGPFHVRFTTVSASVEEGAGTAVPIRVHYVGPAPTSDITIQIGSSGGTAGTDYVISSTDLTIPAGQFFAEFTVTPIDNEIKEPNKVITFTFSSVSGGIEAGQGEVAKQFVLTIIDDDCDIPSLVGTYSVVNRDATPAGCGNPANDAALMHEVAITLVSEAGGVTTYQLSDLTGGMYPNCYGSADNPGQITTNLFDITLTEQPDVVYGGDEFNGTGKMECDGNFTLTWSNNFGDRATSHYTKVN